MMSLQPTLARCFYGSSGVVSEVIIYLYPVIMHTLRSFVAGLSNPRFSFVVRVAQATVIASRSV